MARTRIRALVLAAGHGSRLAPLTHFLPKPLLPVAGSSVIERTLDRLAKAGCEAVAVNLHHLGDALRDHLGEEHRGMPIHYSDEPGERLGTLGALAPLRDFLTRADVVLLLNGDTLCSWPLRTLLRRHLATGASATLLLATRPDPAHFGGGVAVDRERRILAFGDAATPRGEVAARHVFAGAHALAPGLLERVGSGPADIVRQLYRPLLAEGATLSAVLTSRRWHDVGTPRRYLEAVLDWARGPWPVRWWRRSRVVPGARVEPRVRLSSSVVEAGAEVGRGARLVRSLVLPGARVGAGAELHETIVAGGAQVPPRARLQRRVVVTARRGVPSGPDDSRVEDLLYSPLDRAPRRKSPGL